MTSLIRSVCALWGRGFVLVGLLALVLGLGLEASGYVWLPPSSAQAQSLGDPWTGLNAQVWQHAMGEAEELLDGRRMPREARAWVAEGVPSVVVGSVAAAGLWAVALLGLGPLAFLTPIGLARASRASPAARQPVAVDPITAVEPMPAPRPIFDPEPSFADALAKAAEPSVNAEPALDAEAAERVLRHLCNDISRAQQHVLNASLDLKGLNLQDSLAQAREALDRAGVIAEKLRT